MTPKSKREIERRVEEMESDTDAEYPVLNSLALIWGYDWERVEWDDNLRRGKDTGEIYQLPGDKTEF